MPREGGDATMDFREPTRTIRFLSRTLKRACGLTAREGPSYRVAIHGSARTQDGRARSDLSQARDGSVGLTGTPDRAGAAMDLFVGRRAELRRLDEAFDQALQGAGRLVFVTGESGIGKTALVRTFLAVTRQRDTSWTYCRARCAAQYGPAEAYLPFL